MSFNLHVNAEDKSTLDRRTRALSQEAGLEKQLAEAAAEGGDLECMVFSSGGLRYAIEKDYVQELHRGVTPLAVPCTPEFVKGIVNIRGGILSVNDLGLFLGQAPLEPMDKYPMFQLQNEQMLFGVLAERIENIITLSTEQIKPYEQPAKSRLQKYLLGVTLDMTYVLDAQVILSASELIVKS